MLVGLVLALREERRFQGPIGDRAEAGLGREVTLSGQPTCAASPQDGEAHPDHRPDGADRGKPVAVRPSRAMEDLRGLAVALQVT